MSHPAIRVQNLGKRYPIGMRESGYTTFREALAGFVTSPFRRFQSLAGQEAADTTFWALQNVSFEIPPGEVVGIIGHNGAGKSTLLKILSQITEPTTGRVEIHGRIASLLEVGTGFHPELTGRENIFLNGSILGMSRAEVRRKFDEIVAFAEVEKFLDLPVKKYSSGMSMRLAFSVAAHLEPEILIVDEVLAVGDQAFQEKCIGKMESVSRGEGRTVLLVSHNMAAVEALCSTAILLSRGQIVRQGETAEVVQTYLSGLDRGSILSLGDRRDRQGNGAVRFTAVAFSNGNGQGLTSFQCGTAATLSVELENNSGSELRNLRVALAIDNELGQRILLLDSLLVGADLGRIQTGRGAVHFLMPKLQLLPGGYRINIFGEVNGEVADWIKNAGSVFVEGGNYFGTGQLPPHGKSLFAVDHEVWFESIMDEATSAVPRPAAVGPQAGDK